MAETKKQYVYGSYNKKKIAARLLTKGKDGTAWYAGEPSELTIYKTGDFCFNPDTYDIYRYIGGAWTLICNLNNLDKIEEFISEYRAEIELLISQITDSPAYKPWWFGTREEYNAMTQDERNMFELHFIEEGS